MMKEILLGELFLKKGKSLDPSKYSQETFEYYSIPAYDKGFPEIIEGSKIGSSKKILQSGDVVLSRIVPHIRRCWVISEKNEHRKIGSGEWIVFRSDKIENKFLRYYLLSDLFNRKFMKTIKGVGGSLMRADPKQVARFKLNLPPLSEQKKIASILDAADSYRQQSRALIGKYEELGQSLFLEMFGDPVRNEMGWEVKNLIDVCHKVTDGTHQGPKFLNEGIPFLLVSNIVNNKINYQTKKFISEEEYKLFTKSTPIEVGDLLYTSVGSYGRPAIVESDTKFCFQRHIAHIKPNHDLINIRFFHSLMLSPLVKRQADRFALGVAQKTINLKVIKKFRLFNPPLSLQNQFASRIQAIEAQKALAEQSLVQAEDLFQSLLQRAFRGEL